MSPPQRVGRGFRLIVTLVFALAGAVDARGQDPAAPGHERLRIIVETDAGGDPDDEQSLVRFLLYANEWDVEGLIANRPVARERENLNPERTGLDIVRAHLKAYAQCYANLAQHDRRYPSPEQLWARTVPGYDTTEGGVRLIIAAVDRPDPRPVWFCNWGTDNGAAASSLKRALDRVLKERGPQGYARFKDRLRLSSYDKFDEHTTNVAPPFRLWVDTFHPAWEGKRWYHRFSALTATAGGFDLQRDARAGHGPLGALYPTNTTHRQKEGDSMTFLYLVPTGLNEPEQPGWGSWAGRYGLNENHPGKNYYWANQVDAWRGATNRDNTLARWAADLQNDFRARLDWCVQPFPRANHAPLARLNGTPGRGVVRLKAAAGANLLATAEGSRDPDGSRLSYEWFVYREVGTCQETARLGSPHAERTTLTVPTSAAGKTLHLVLRVADDGEPPLAAYRRLVLTVESASAPEALWRDRSAAAY